MQASVRSSLRSCAAQLEDQLGRQADELRQQRALRNVLDDQLDSNQQEMHLLRNRVCQLQHGQYVQKCCQGIYTLTSACTSQQSLL